MKSCAALRAAQAGACALALVLLPVQVLADPPATPSSPPSAPAASVTTPAAAVATTPTAPETPAAGSAASTPAADAAKSEAVKSSATDATQSPAPAATPAAAPAVDPVIEALRRRLADKAFVSKTNAEDVAALQGFYGGRADPLWIKDGAFNERGKAIITESKKADDWGLNAATYAVVDPASGANADALAEAEAKLSFAALAYARHARGGRVDPVSLSNILDMKPPVKDPKEVIAALSTSSEPDVYLRGLNPKHPQFEALRHALLKARGPAQPEAPIDEALKVKLPEGKTLKKGIEHDDVALLRKRLKIETPENANARMFDDQVEVAVEKWQGEHDLKDNGQLNSKTRTALNREGEPKKAADPKRDIDQIVVNMERWRWLPEDLGPFYVINNIPEFVSRTMKGNDEVLKQKIIVGQPTWPTPVLTASMEFVIFHPDWGVPDGIKMKELLPRLKRASGDGGGFFDQLFGGGSSGGARVLEAYKLTPTLNGRPIDANKVNWNSVDIRQFSFTQPPGGENPLGNVKFRFPNRHDVYMHDTPQKGLFGQSYRALSHGCMRVEQPRKLAEVILEHDKGMSADKVGGMWNSGGDVTLSTPVPVYLTYFTVRADADGKLVKFGDIYGHDSRLGQALNGRSIKYEAPAYRDDDVVASASDDDDPSPQPAKKSSKKQQQQTAKKKKPGQETAGDILTNALSGLLAN